MLERRKFVRLSANVQIRWKKIDTLPEQNNIDFSKNVSCGGICLITFEPLTPGDNISLELIFPSGKKIITKGKVVWSQEYGISTDSTRKRFETGIEMSNLEESEKEEIDKFLFGLLNLRKPN